MQVPGETIVQGVDEDGCAEDVAATGLGELSVSDASVNELLYHILTELREIRLHMRSMTDQEFSGEDLKDDH